MSDLSAADIVGALDRKYGQKAENNEQWVVIPEARSGAGFDGNRRQCDYLAINTHQGRGLQLIGHEIKVSEVDWKRELEDPEKAELFARHCRRWWLVMPSALARQVRDEIPPMWGLMSVSDAGRITDIRKAPAREPVEVPVWWWVGWLAQLDRREKRARRSEIDRLVTERVESERQDWERTWKQNNDYRDRQAEDLQAKVNAFRDATGIDLRHAWKGTIDRVKRVWQLSQSGQDLEVIAQRIREAADLLDALIEEPKTRI